MDIDNDVLDPEVQASVDFAAQEKRATPPDDQIFTFLLFLLLQFSLFFFSFHLIELFNEKIESRNFQTILHANLSFSIVLVSVFVLMILQFGCLCHSRFYKFPFHVIEVFDEKRDSHQSQMISRNSPDVHQTKREPVNYPNCFTHSVFFIFSIYRIAYLIDKVHKVILDMNQVAE